MAVNAEALLPPLIFTGQANSVVPGDKSPADFVRIIEQRAAQHAWNDVTTMKHAIACIQGEAAQWLYGSFKLTISPEEWTRISDSWAAFSAVFKSRYRIREVPSQTDLSGIRKQAPGESTMKFMDRVARTFGTLIGKESFLSTFESIDVATMPEGVRTAVNATEEARVAVANIIEQHEKRLEHHTFIALIETLVKKTIASGLRHEYAQQSAYTMLDRTTNAGRISLFEFQNKILEITERKDVIARSSQAVKAVDIEDSDEDTDHEAVQAVRAKSTKKKNKKREGGNSNPKDPSKLHWSKDPDRNPSFGKQCEYCQKFNHVRKDCYKRKRDETKKTGQKVAATTQEAGNTEGGISAAKMDGAKPRARRASLNF